MPAVESVLIVDDESDHAFIIRHVLGGVLPGAAVDAVATLDGARAWLESAPRGTLVLLDRQVAGEDSIAVLASLAAARPDVAFVLLSAAISDPDRARAEDAGAVLVAEKAGSLDGWRTLLRRAVELCAVRGA